MLLRENDGVKYFVFESLEKTGVVNHCFSTRVGGVSQGAYQWLTLSFTRGDEREKVTENFKRITKAIQSDISHMVSASQVHDTKIRHVTKEDCGKGILRESDLKGYDGLMTNEPGVLLTTFHADCVPLYFVDPIKRVIALSHAGWRGTVNRMAEKTVDEMTQVYGCSVCDIITGIGPAIGRCCFEVGEEVALEFREKIPCSSQFIRPMADKEGKYKIDLKGINRHLLEEKGVAQISVADQCTMCMPQYFYSHRRMGEERGSMAAFLELR